MKKLVIGVLFLFFCGFVCLDLSVAQATDLPDKKQIITKAHNAYYSLRNLGLSEFQASIRPNWELTLKKELQSNPEGAQNGLKMLQLMEEMRDEASRVLQDCLEENIIEIKLLQEHLHDGLGQLVYDRTGRRPMILPVVVEV